MSFCVSHGKDKVMFLTEEDLKGPSSIELKEIDEPRGIVLPNGEINFGCPCLGNAAVGPCSVQFRSSISCFHESMADPKGSDCLEQFRAMSDCMAKYPTLFKRNEEADTALDSLQESNFEQTDVSDSEKPVEGKENPAK